MAITRGGLPAQVSNDILQIAEKKSAVMQLARKIPVTGRGVTVPVILGDATAEWVAEGAQKPVSDASVTHKLLQPYKIAVIDTYSKELVRDERAFYEALVGRLPGSLAKVFDSTVAGGTTKPGTNFTQLSDTSNTGVEVAGNDAYADLVGIMSTIAQKGGLLNGYALGAQGQAALLGATDTTGRPLFAAGTEAGTLQPILGGIARVGEGIYAAAASEQGANTIGYAGDWSQAAWGTVADVELEISEEATLKLANNQTVNLWQNNLVAVKAEIEIGFVANADVFVAITD